MKRFLFLILLLSIIINPGCLVWLSGNEMVMKKKDFKVLEQNSRRLIISEELYLLSKKEWSKKEIYKYSLTPETNTQFLGVIGAYKGLYSVELILFTKEGRQIKEVQSKIDEQLLKLKKETIKKGEK